MLHGNSEEQPKQHSTDYRMVAIDLDGTLLRKDGTMGERTRLALQAAVRQGIKVVICTGRRFRTTLPILSELQLAVPVIVHGGLLIKDAGTYETLYHSYLDQRFRPCRGKIPQSPWCHTDRVCGPVRPGDRHLPR